MRKTRKKTQQHLKRQARLGPSSKKRRAKRKREADERRDEYYEKLIRIERNG